MRWLKKQLRNWINDDGLIALDDHYAIRSTDEPNGKCIRFKVFQASGGTVVQTDYYDHKHDKEHNNLHVIVEGQDLGQELGKIITYESLKL
jgi:hypothetical protein